MLDWHDQILALVDIGPLQVSGVEVAGMGRHVYLAAFELRTYGPDRRVTAYILNVVNLLAFAGIVEPVVEQVEQVAVGRNEFGV